MTSRRKRAGTITRQRTTTWIAATQPGLGKLAAADIRSAGASVDGIESDGRSDLVVFDTADIPSPRALALVEDLFVAVGIAPTAQQARTVASRLFDSATWQTGAEIARSRGIRIGATTGFRVIARVRSERNFKRTELRGAVTDVVQRWRPRWRLRDPADLEIWILETRPGQFRAAMRLSSSEMRSRGGKVRERKGSLRPTVAAAIVRAAGLPSGSLLDPFCGSGTVLAEAQRAGWNDVRGSDVDPEAVAAARANLKNVEIGVADAIKLPMPDASLAAIATNAPFGIQHVPRTREMSLETWWRVVLSEFARVVRPGGAVVILHPGDAAFTQAVRHDRDLTDSGQIVIRTLGQPASIWTLRRT